jgi:hypothetical protein
MEDLFFTLLVPDYVRRRFLKREFSCWEDLYDAWEREDQCQMIVGWSEDGKVEERIPVPDRDGNWYIWKDDQKIILR